jgi:hypothetical protein
MRTLTTRIVALVAGAVTMGMPAVLAAEEAKPCPTSFYVQSNATGGDYVMGLLFSEEERPAEISTVRTTNHAASATAETELKLPVGSASASGTASTGTTTIEKVVIGGTYNVGIYKMNDGSTWAVNCDFGLAIKQVG